MAKTTKEPVQAATMPPAAVAARLGIDRATLYRWLKRGVMPQPQIRVGRTVRWSVQAVDKFITEGVQA